MHQVFYPSLWNCKQVLVVYLSPLFVFSSFLNKRGADISSLTPGKILWTTNTRWKSAHLETRNLAWLGWLQLGACLGLMRKSEGKLYTMINSLLKMLIINLIYVGLFYLPLLVLSLLLPIIYFSFESIFVDAMTCYNQSCQKSGLLYKFTKNTKYCVIAKTRVI